MYPELYRELHVKRFPRETYYFIYSSRRKDSAAGTGRFTSRGRFLGNFRVLDRSFTERRRYF